MEGPIGTSGDDVALSGKDPHPYRRSPDARSGVSGENARHSLDTNARQDRTPATRPGWDEAPMRTQHRLSVLIVDDYPDAADSLAELLRLYGHRAAVARTAREALSVAERELPDVVLLELRLREMDGWQVARRLRERAGTGDRRRLLLVAVTGCGREEDHRRSAAAGIDLHLVKPVDPDLLRQVLMVFARRWATTTHPPGETSHPHASIAHGSPSSRPVTPLPAGRRLVVRRSWNSTSVRTRPRS
jgi:CheY-like chemotaxis protein